MTDRRVRPVYAAAIASAALALSPASAGAHPADCAGASPFTSSSIAVSFADWTVDCTHAAAARGAADSDVELASSTLEGIDDSATASTTAAPVAADTTKTGALAQVGTSRC